MSLPLPYGEKRTGAERSPPARRGPRPYAERLKHAPELVKQVGPSKNTFLSALPGAAAILMVCGAVAPLAYAHPDIRAALFAPLVDATDPLSAGLRFAADAIWTGWQAGIILTVAAMGGYLAWLLGRATEGRRAGAAGIRLAAGVVAAVATVVAAFLLYGLVLDLGSAAGAAWVILTGVGGAIGAWKAQSRSDYQGAVGGAVALMLGGRFVFGGVALVMVAMSDKEFPGQHVAPYNWRRSQVSIDPVRPPAAPVFTEGDWDLPHRAGWSWPWAPQLAGFLLLVGALAPFGYWEPFRAAFFGPLVEALHPLTSFVPIVSDAFWTLEPVVSAYILVMSLVAIGAARFAFGATRPAAVLAGAVALIASGRVITGVMVLAILLFSVSEFDKEKAGSAHGAEPATSAH